MKCAYYSLIYYNNVREVQHISSKLINQAMQIYYYNLGGKLSYPKIGKKSFWIAFKRIVNTKKQTYILPIEIGAYIYIYMTFCERLIGIMNSMNVLSMAMVSYYLHTSPRQTNPFLISLSLRNKLLILFPSVMQIYLKGMIISLVAILQVCPSKVAIPLQIIFQKCISSGTFPNFWKYANIQHISLLPICGKILEKIIFDHVYVFLNNNSIISKH